MGTQEGGVLMDATYYEILLANVVVGELVRTGLLTKDEATIILDKFRDEERSKNMDEAA